MTTITLEAIKTEHAKVAEMIATFEAQTKVRELVIGAQKITLQAGEEYAGVILGKDGAPGHHLVLLSGAHSSINWSDSMAWAASLGGDLPTRREQSLLFANLKEQFKEEAYWSNEQHAAGSDCAWYQDFHHGHQDTYSKHGKLRARAVRRLIIE